MNRDKVLDRIQRLLRLAESDNVHEAASAAARAQELMTRHRIEAAALEAAGGGADGIVDHRDTPLDASKRLRKWKTFLASAVAQANGCRVYILTRGKVHELVLVGHPEDAELVRELYDALRVRIEALTRRHGAGHDRAFQNAFRLGAVTTVAERIELARARAAERALGSGDDSDGAAEREDAAEARLAGPGVALAVARLDDRDEAVDRFVNEHLNLQPAKRRTLRADAEGYARGRIAGHGVDL